MLRSCRLVVFASLLIAPAGVHAQTTQTSAEQSQAVLRELAALRQEVKEIKALLEEKQATLPVGASRAQTLPENLSKDITLPFVPQQVLGTGKAGFVVVEFADLQCPFCSYFNKKTYPSFEKAYVDSGKVKFMSVDFPLESHPDAARMSLASICAGAEGKYWPMRDALMQAGSLSSGNTLEDLGSKLHLDAPKESLHKFCVHSVIG